MRETLPLGGHHAFDVLVARRLLKFYRRFVAENLGAKDIMDLGCGPGHLAAEMAKRPESIVTGLDIDPVQVRLARRNKARNLRYHVGASHDIPLPDASQDWILATETYHHWSAPRESISEVRRVLRPGGEFWIVEGSGDMTRSEIEAWTGRKPFPGLSWWIRRIFTQHGYTDKALRTYVVPALEAGGFTVDVERWDGWWVVKAR